MNNGLSTSARVEADTLAEATYLAWLACYRNGVRVADVKHIGEDPLGYDISLLVHVRNPLTEPRIFKPGLPSDPESLEVYRLEVVHGIHDGWVNHGWDYTYHQRMAPQFEPMLAKIERTWMEKGRITSRDFQMTTWRGDTDYEIDDPPCLQVVHLRFLPTADLGKYLLNLTVVFRSRDLGNAFLMNALAFTDLQRYLSQIVTNRLSKWGITVGVGTYTDFSISNHLYGADQRRRQILRTLGRMEVEPWERFAMDYQRYMQTVDMELLHSKIAAQLHVEEITRGTEEHSFLPTPELMKMKGIDWSAFPYPSEWNW